MFLFVMLPLSVVMVGALYWQNSQLAVNLTADAMKRASKDIVISVQGLLDPVARTVNLSAVMGVNRQGSVRQPELERTLLEGLSERREGMAQGFTRDMHQTRERLA